MPRLLLVTLAFPPVASPSSFGAAKTFARLPGWQVDVLTVDPARAALPADASLDGYVRNGFHHIVRVPAPRWARLRSVRTAWMACAAVTRIPDLGYLRRPFLDAARTLDLAGYDALVTWSQPHVAHRIGLELKALMPRARWLARLGDPWSSNPYLPAIPPFPALDRRREAEVFGAVDAVGLPSEEMRDFVFADMPPALGAKAFVLPQCADETLFPDADVPVVKDGDHAEYVIRCMGKCYGARSPEAFFAAIAHLAGEEPAVLDRVRCECFGDMGGYDRLLRRYPRAAPFVRIGGSVPYRDSLRLMRSADCLLTIDAPARHNIFFPSKLAEYVTAGPFLAAITPPGATARAVEHFGGVWADPTAPEACLAMLRALLRERLRRRLALPNPYAPGAVQAGLLDRLGG